MGVARWLEAPQADRIIAVAPVARILYLETALPPVSRAKRNALLNYAIEDKLTIDPDTVHATVLGESRDAEHVVSVVDRWLSSALAWLRRRPCAAHPGLRGRCRFGQSGRVGRSAGAPSRLCTARRWICAAPGRRAPKTCRLPGLS